MKSHQIQTSMSAGMLRWTRTFLSHCSFVWCTLSGDLGDSQFWLMKKVKAPEGAREVRVSSSSCPACSRTSCGSSVSSFISLVSEIT